MENDKKLYLVFVDLEKAFDRVLKVLIESSLRRKGVMQCYVKAVVKMYKEVLSQVKVEDGLEGVCSESGHTLRVSPFAIHLCCGDGCGDRGGSK